jgi:pantothenate kinase-related protein Tda10
LGKTTLMADVCGQMVGRGSRVVTLSIDDFYLRTTSSSPSPGAIREPA